jgi:hypothetical protein
MEKFKTEFEIGEIFRRDKWQFELKSEFFPSPKLKKNIYKQEFYFFIPNALQINDDNYTMKEFYHDQTNLIRYKTPIFSIQDLLDENNPLSPFIRIKQASEHSMTIEIIDLIEDELKLLANIIRSLLRKRAGEILQKIMKGNKDIESDIHSLCTDIVKLTDSLSELEVLIIQINSTFPLLSHYYYANEFIHSAIRFYLTGLLDRIRAAEIHLSAEIEDEMTKLIIKGAEYEDNTIIKTKLQAEEEYVFYKRGLLNKFILDALLLYTSRQMVLKRYSNLIASVAAGIAMLFFFILFIWQGTVFIINSIPFILITVLLYIAKDRIKEGIRNVSYQHFHRWFPDYVTEIRSPDGKYPLGSIEESFSFIKESELPIEIVKMRNREFHNILEAIKRPERILYYKRKIALLHPPKGNDIRRSALNIIFRFNISNFVHKADNPFHVLLKLDPKTHEIMKKRLPKVYHFNMILKNTYIDESLTKKVEFKKFRLILDKNGIKRLEQLS